MVHLIYEHKRGIYERLQFILSEQELGNEFSRLMGRLKGIVDRLQDARLLLLQYMAQKNKEIIERAIGLVDSVRQDELGLLIDICEQLRVAVARPQ